MQNKTLLFLTTLNLFCAYLRCNAEVMETFKLTLLSCFVRLFSQDLACFHLGACACSKQVSCTTQTTCWVKGNVNQWLPCLSLYKHTLCGSGRTDAHLYTHAYAIAHPRLQTQPRHFTKLWGRNIGHRRRTICCRSAGENSWCAADKLLLHRNHANIHQLRNAFPS